MIDRYLALVVPEASAEIAKTWIAILREAAPPGILVTQPMPDGRHALLVKRRYGSKEAWLAPLTRDLLPEEGDRIAEALCGYLTDFLLVTHAMPYLPQQPMIAIPDAHLVSVGQDMAKRRHTDWVREREADGWRYGPTISVKDRTHPLIRPWSELPDRYRKADLDAPQLVVDLLRDHGYVVVPRDSLDRLLSAISAA